MHAVEFKKHFEPEEYTKIDNSTEINIQPKSFFLNTQLWSKNHTTGLYEIPVCWEEAFIKNSWMANLTKQALSETWEKYSLVKFVGWDTCTSNNQGVRINAVTDPTKGFSSWVYALGSHLNGKKNYVYLDFNIWARSIDLFVQYNNWSFAAVCADNNVSAADCLKSIITHEFGHILGVSHEQSRNDDPSELRLCRTAGPEVGSNGELWWGNVMLPAETDEKSIMHYCNPNYPGQKTLSYYDKVGLQVHYGEIPVLRGASIKVPRLRVNNIMYRVNLNDWDGDGYYTYNLFELPGYSLDSYDNHPTVNLNEMTLTLPLIKTVSTSVHSKRERVSSIHNVKMKGVWRSNQWQFHITDKALIANVENTN